ncbi:Isoprenylcysteine carboxyl methyltransferase like protein [Aduncisulcus paluster]|uniref:Protein-S-isoprenylcysteine O-methyltransferase n=2 Tax=Aduncisulcus paluster TaxID=2918883 RepID=A0ABQ5K6R1_9EUKA|nr:Isoprenylcysteine carboxyl methyltransferase like protein [Aduncisulcus paluster]
MPDKKVGYFGIGGKLAMLTVLFCSPFILLDVFSLVNLPWPPYFPAERRNIFGFVMIGCGVACLIASAIQHSKFFPKDKLCTSGVYYWCQHPIYSAWILFLIPGFVVIFGRTWLLLICPFLTALALKLLISEEEKDLTRMFGDDYLIYKASTPMIVPLFKIFKRPPKNIHPTSSDNICSKKGSTTKHSKGETTEFRHKGKKK